MKEFLLARVAAVRRFARQSLCPVVHGGHELYTARAATKLSQVCLLCGYETRGWALAGRPRLRSHLAGRLRASSLLGITAPPTVGGRASLPTTNHQWQPGEEVNG